MIHSPYLAMKIMKQDRVDSMYILPAALTQTPACSCRSCTATAEGHNFTPPVPAVGGAGIDE